MTEGRQREGEQKAEPTGKVVRLPRDWLGPREELVPFGRHSASPESDLAGPALSSEAATLLVDSPPTAADFWGERSAAIHDAVTAPPEVPVVVANESGSRAAHPARRRGRRPLIAGIAFVIAAVAAVSVLSGAFGLGGSGSQTASGPRLDIAAVVSNGVARTLHRGLALLHVSAGRPARTAADHRAPAQHRARTSHRSSRPHPAFSSTTIARSVSAYVPPPAPTVTTTPSETSSPPIQSASSPAPSQSHPSRATVSPTGESGALGPIQSPNG